MLFNPTIASLFGMLSEVKEQTKCKTLGVHYMLYVVISLYIKLLACLQAKTALHNSATVLSLNVVVLCRVIVQPQGSC